MNKYKQGNILVNRPEVKVRVVKLVRKLLSIFSDRQDDFWLLVQALYNTFQYYIDKDLLVTDSSSEPQKGELYKILDNHIKKHKLQDNFRLVSQHTNDDKYNWHQAWNPYIHSLGEYYHTDKSHIPYTEEYQNKLLTDVKSGYFICYNGVVKYARMILLNEMKRYGLENKGVISMLGIKESKTYLEDYLTENENYPYDYEKEFFHNFNFIPDEDVLKIPNSYPLGSGGNATFYFNKSHFENNYFCIVTETQPAVGYHDWSTLHDRNTSSITEKTIKAVSVAPFIINAERGVLKQLKRLGFETFPEWFDESYDEMEMSENKVMIIAKNINRICSMSLEDVHELYVKTFPKIIHNQNLILKYYNDNKIKQVETNDYYRFSNDYVEIHFRASDEDDRTGFFYLNDELIAKISEGRLV